MNERTNSDKPNVEQFTAYSIFPKSLTFEGINQQALVEFAKRYGFIEGYKSGVGEGREIAYKEMEATIVKLLERYTFLTIKIVDFVKEEISKKYRVEVFKLIEARPDLYKFVTKTIEVVFVIDTDIENQQWFVSLLNGLEKKILLEDRYVVELRFINTSGKTIDKNLLESNFPFVRK